MNQGNFFVDFGVQLDLAVEAHQLARGAAQTEIQGVIEDKENFPDAAVTTIVVENAAAAQAMGKPPGTYITIEAPGLRENDPPVHDNISEVLANKLAELMQKMNIPQDAQVLVVGLGNWAATPDALGPKVTSHILVSRHLKKYVPDQIGPGIRPVSALSPGVMGITGIETAEIIRGTVEKVKPACVIAIDALAATSVGRICSTIQIADTGISPGSGVGNRREGLDMNSLGIPVIAVGIPTVVNAAVVLFDAFDRLRQSAPGLSSQLQQPMMQQIANQLLEPFGGQLTVTPKEIDELIDNLSTTVATALNEALHQEVKPENAHLYLM